MTKLAENNPQGTANIADDRVLCGVFTSMPTWKLVKYQLEISRIIADREVNQILIDDLDISVRCYQLLKQQNIKYLNQLCHLKKDDMVKFRNFGSKSLQELDEVMKLKGLSWLS